MGELRGDFSIVMEAVKQNGLALQHARDALRRNHKIVRAALKQNGLALVHVAGDLRSDCDFMLAALEQDVEEHRHDQECRRGNAAQEDTLKNCPPAQRHSRLLKRPSLRCMAEELHKDCERLLKDVVESPRKAAKVSDRISEPLSASQTVSEILEKDASKFSFEDFVCDKQPRLRNDISHVHDARSNLRDFEPVLVPCIPQQHKKLPNCEAQDPRQELFKAYASSKTDAPACDNQKSTASSTCVSRRSSECNRGTSVQDPVQNVLTRNSRSDSLRRRVSIEMMRKRSTSEHVCRLNSSRTASSQADKSRGCDVSMMSFSNKPMYVRSSYAQSPVSSNRRSRSTKYKKGYTSATIAFGNAVSNRRSGGIPVDALVI